MRSAAAAAAVAGADLIDINMGCPVRKVCKAGAGAALLKQPELAVRLAWAAAKGSCRPVTVKLRSGLEAGDRSSFELAIRLARAGMVAALAFHPRNAAAHHQGRPDYALARELAARVEVPVIISGGLDTAERARIAYQRTGADAVMVARGALGNPWIFEELTGQRAAPPSRTEIVDELLWTMDRAEEHLGRDRATRYLRKFYPWYLERLGIRGPAADRFQRTVSLEAARALLAGAVELAPVAA